MGAPALSQKPDPMVEINALIDRARNVDDPIAVPGDESFDPIARLNLRLAQAHPYANQEPLLSLYDDLTDGQSIPKSDPHEVAEDPMDRLAALASGELPHDAEPEVEENVSPVESGSQDYSAIESILGREVLELAGSSALSPEAR